MPKGELHLRQLRRMYPDSFAARVLRFRPLLFVLLVGGAALATVASLMYLPSNPSDELLPPETQIVEGVSVRATIRAVDAARGEMSVRLVATPWGRFRAPDGTLAIPVTLVVNDTAGRSVIGYPATFPMPAVDVTLALTGGRIVRYPFDTYEASLLVLSATETTDKAQLPIDTSLEVISSVDEVQLAAVRGKLGLRSARFTINRPVASRAWVVFLMVMMWALGLAAAAVAWVVIVWRQPQPFWSWSYFVGVLFALPSLRSNLPGSPPNGSLVDIAAFYWAIGLVAASLVAMLVTWNVRVRDRARAQAGNAGDNTMEQWAVRPLDDWTE